MCTRGFAGVGLITGRKTVLDLSFSPPSALPWSTSLPAPTTFPDLAEVFQGFLRVKECLFTEPRRPMLDWPVQEQGLEFGSRGWYLPHSLAGLTRPSLHPVLSTLHLLHPKNTHHQPVLQKCNTVLQKCPHGITALCSFVACMLYGCICTAGDDGFRIEPIIILGGTVLVIFPRLLLLRTTKMPFIIVSWICAKKTGIYTVEWTTIHCMLV